MQDKHPNFFRDYLAKTDSRTLIKMDHYLDVYNQKLGKSQGVNINFLEIGIYKGGSIGLWKSFWGPDSKLTFLDIDPSCKQFAEDGINIEIGDQSDFNFMNQLGKRNGPFHLIIDDGGHTMNQQITSFKALWPHLRPNGLYIIEDVHTSYWPGFGGGLKEPGSTIEFAKDLIDQMNSWYTDDDENFPMHPIRNQIDNISFYDSMIFIQKTQKTSPVQISSSHGKVGYSDKILKVRGRKSIF